MSSTDPLVLLHQAGTWIQDGQFAEAEEALRRLLVTDPTCADALNLLAVIHHQNGDREMGIRLARAAVALDPSAGRYHTNLGTLLGATGDRDGAAAAFRRAVALNPTLLPAWYGLIFEGDLSPYCPPEQRLADRREYNARFCAALTAAAPPHTNDPDPDRPLHVGYISADFTNHSASMVFAPMFDGHEPAAGRISAYWQNEAPADGITEHLRARVNGVWREVAALSDEQLAQQIRDDGVDILVDLSGFSTGSRVLALARKPAPVIITAWGHITGLGIDACDYLMADAVTVPPEDERLHHERILRAPCIVAYNPFAPIPDPAEPPARRRGYTTFGYLGRPCKTSPAVWGVWAQILHRVPHSRLLLKHAEWRSPSYRQRILDAFAALGISDTRIEFRLSTTRFEHLATHAEVDVCLDPFPQGGGVTLLEATVMGVPSVVLHGRALNERIAPSILHAIGRDGWIADSLDEYIECAVDIAEVPMRLETRLALREDLLGSVLCRPYDYAAAVEAEYRTAWRTWCAEQRKEEAA